MEYNFKWFKEKVYELTSIDLNKYKEQQMERRIHTYVYRRLKLDYEQFYKVIENDTYQLNNFIEYLTINVSEFFRNPEQWIILKEQVIPNLMKSRDRLKIWSSACSTGEEPYSLAMIMDEILPRDRYEIIASDLDNAVIKTAKQGIYRLPQFDVIPKEEYEDKVFVDFAVANLIAGSYITLVTKIYIPYCDDNTEKASLLDILFFNSACI